MIYSSVICWESSQVSSWDKLSVICQLVLKLTPPVLQHAQNLESWPVFVSCCWSDTKNDSVSWYRLCLVPLWITEQILLSAWGGCVLWFLSIMGGQETSNLWQLPHLLTMSEQRRSWSLVCCTTWRMIWTSFRLTWNFKSAVPTSLVLVLVVCDQKHPLTLCLLLFAGRKCGIRSVPPWDFFPQSLKMFLVLQLPPEIKKPDFSPTMSHCTDESPLNVQTRLL